MKVVNQQLIKNTNIKNLYTAIDSNPGISRANLAKLTKLSKTTVSTLIDELIEREYILDLGTQTVDTIGRKPNSLRTRPNSHYIVVMNWVENMVYAYLIDIAGSSIYHTEKKLSNGETYVTGSRICLYEDILKNYDQTRILGICIVLSAMIDINHNEFYSTTLSLPFLGDDNRIDSLKNIFPEFSVDFLEDTACYAYAEKVYAQVKDRNFAFLNFGRGIGATLFIEGSMLGKASGSFTQFGHYSIDPDGPLCVCGNHGCVERLISEQYLKERINQFGQISSLKDQNNITFAELGKAATFRDATALAVVKQLAKELTPALANLICIVNPSLIILGGNIPALGNYFLDELRKNLTQTGFRKMVDNVTLRYSSLPSDSFINGAMKYFFDIHYSFAEDSTPTFFVG